MRILGIDTATNACSAAVMEDGRIIGQTYLHTAKKHSATLLPALQELLALLGLSLQDMDGVAVCAGPGSFTGVHIGVATASAFSYVLGCPVHEVSTLDALLEAAPDGLLTCALLDARRDQVYVKAQYGDEVVIHTDATALSEVLSLLKDRGPVLFTGDGALAHCEEIQAAVDGAMFTRGVQMYPTAAGACMCAAAGNAKSRSHDTLRTIYLRPPQAQRALLEKRKREADAQPPYNDPARDAR